MESIQIQKPHQILYKALARKQLKAGGYSQRTLAREIGISPVFLTKILTGKKTLPLPRIKKMCRLLDLDINAEKQLMQSLLYYSVPAGPLRELVLEGIPKKSGINDYTTMTKKKFSILRDWYNLAILDLLTCEIDTSIETIAKKLKLTNNQVTEAMTGLEKEGLAIQENGFWKKTEQKIFFPTTKTQSEVRGFHKQMIKKAYDELSKTTPEAFEERLITGMTIAANPQKLVKAKEKIFDILSELSETLSDGQCKEVYQFNVQLFPLTKKKVV